MRPEKVFKRYDIRGKYPEELDEEFAERLGKALGTFLAAKNQRRVAVCRDNKSSSHKLKEELIKGLKSVGVEVLDVGEGPTDYAAWCGRREGCVSVEVTSSHMPLDFNGFKFMYPEGNGFVNKDLYKVQDIFRNSEFRSGEGSIEERSLLKDYKEELKGFASDLANDFEKKVVVQPMGGTANILPKIMEDLGLEVVNISEEDYPYIDPPNPKTENLADLAEAVDNSGADLGIANDLDADRVTVYYKGRFLTGDEVFCILAQLVSGKVVASIDTSKALESFAEVNYTRVGDPFVMSKALEPGAEFAGEPNGHYSFTEFVAYNSGMLAALILSGLDLDERLEKIPDYFVKRAVVEAENRHDLVDVYASDLDEEKVISDLDGVKFERNGAEVLVRPSGSSQKIRVICESLEESVCEKVVEDVKDELSVLSRKS